MKSEKNKNRNPFTNLEEQIYMQENMIESCDKKVLDLNEDLNLRKKCDQSIEPEEDLRTHDSNHTDENVPSSSKCGEREIESEDLKVHI